MESKELKGGNVRSTDRIVDAEDLRRDSRRVCTFGRPRDLSWQLLPLPVLDLFPRFTLGLGLHDLDTCYRQVFYVPISQ